MTAGLNPVPSAERSDERGLLPTQTVERLRRWSTYGVVELHKELEHLRRSMPGSTAISDLERYLGERRDEAERTYGGGRIEAQ